MKKLLAFMGIFCLIVPLVFLGCEGDDGAPGAPGEPGTPGPPGITGTVEQCSICHSKTGDELQASYDELYQDGVIQVTELGYTNIDNNDVVTFTMTGPPGINCETVDNLNIYFVAYDNGSFQFDPPGARLSIKGAADNVVDDGEGNCTSTKAQSVYGDLRELNGLVIVYGYHDQVGSLPARIRQVKYPYAAILPEGTVDYLSAANNDGCEKCHTDPYLKHGNIYAQVGGDDTTDFMTCKACHLDDGEGGHFEWQLLLQDPALAARFLAGETSDAENDEIAAKYAYLTNLKNDVHMSHAMEFPYPQRMSNCVVCHEGKLETILADSNFVAETCKSCHVETEDPDNKISEKRPPAMSTLWPTGHSYSFTCNSCHGVSAKSFNAIHTGYDKQIYFVDNAVATKYSAAITVTIDNASFDNNILNIEFSAEGTLGTLDAADIVPDLLVGLYGWGTKDFIVSPHGRTVDNDRDLEITITSDNVVHPRISVETAEGGNWVVNVDLSAWADLIAADNVTKVEIGVTPYLAGTDNVPVALNGVSRTFDLGANDFADDYFQGDEALVRVDTGCNECHEALAITFHTNDPGRGGNIVICRLCHVTLNAGSHLEMQSRSIDSYVHAIHSFQAFDIGDIDFSDPVEAMHYEHHIEFPYPKHGSTDCESCHNPGKYNAPDQSKSLPGLLSSSDYPLQGWVRNIGEVPQYVTGPGTRACGACHRSMAINEDSTGELEMLFSHWKTNGYMEEDGSDALYAKIFEIMGLFP